MRRMSRSEDAVSPVIGVMLMIVVTVIIAAVVSAFTGGIGIEEHKVPNAALEVTPDLDGNGTIEFHQEGGSVLDIDEILVQLECEGRTITLSNGDTMTGHANFSYITELGGRADGYIDAGDRFILTPDKNDAVNKCFVFQTSTMAANNFTVPYNSRVSYLVLDKNSGKAIQMGEFRLR